MKIMKYMMTRIVAAIFAALLVACANTTTRPSGMEEQKLVGSIPEPSSWQFPDVIESARKLTPRNLEGKPFDRFGLAYSLEELERIDVVNLPVAVLQNYADIVTHAYPDAVAKYLPSECGSVSINQLNGTSFGNVAYISINAINPDTKKWAAQCLKIMQSNFAKMKSQNG